MTKQTYTAYSSTKFANRGEKINGEYVKGKYKLKIIHELSRKKSRRKGQIEDRSHQLLTTKTRPQNKPDMDTYACSTSTQKAEAGGLQLGKQLEK